MKKTTYYTSEKQVLESLKDMYSHSNYRIKKLKDSKDYIAKIFEKENDYVVNTLYYENGHKEDDIMWYEIEGRGYGFLGAHPDEDMARELVKNYTLKLVEEALLDSVEHMFEVDCNASYEFTFFEGTQETKTIIIPRCHIRNEDVHIAFTKNYI